MAVKVLAILALVMGCQMFEPKDTLGPILKRGDAYARDGLYKDAVSTYKRALNQSPNNPNIHRGLGIIYVKIGDYKKATFHLEKSLKKFHSNFETNFYLGEAYRARERFGQAIFRYNKALEQQPKSTKALKAVAWSYYKVRFYAEALRSSSRLRRLGPLDHQTAIITSRTLLKLGRFKKALKILRKSEVLAKKGEIPYLKSVEGDILLKMGKTDAAERAYRLALKDQPLLAGALFGLGKSLLKNRRDQTVKAIDYIERAVRVKPRLKEALFFLGRHYQKVDPRKSKKYLRSFQKLAAADPEFQKELLEIKKYKAKKRKPIPLNPAR